MWLGHASASRIFTFFCSHNFLSITPISAFIFPYISLRRYFGAKTIWYLHLHFECDKLFMSVMTKPPFAFSAVDEPAAILAKGGFLVSKYF